MGNAVQLQQVVLNLLRNALEALTASPPGTREVEISTHRTADGDIEIRVATTARASILRSPTGCSIHSATTKGTGTGLGLAISRTIVHAHGGTIGTRTDEPHGACFYVRLPVAEEYQS